MDQFTPGLRVREGVVAVRLAAGRDGYDLAPTFTRVWPVEQSIPFTELLRRIDEAECGPASADHCQPMV